MNVSVTRRVIANRLTMNDTRRAVLEHIHLHGPMTVADLAAHLQVSPISIRHHLNSLQAEGSLSISLQWGKVGRPRHVYALTGRAAQYFPSEGIPADDFPMQARAAINRLLEKLRARLAPLQLEALLERMGSALIARYSASATMAAGSLDSLASRVQQVVHTLGEAGFRAEVQPGVQQGEGALILKTAHCPQSNPQPDVARQDLSPTDGPHNHIEVCRIDQSLIRSVLGSPVEQTACVLHGDRSCVFSVQA